MEKVNKIKLSSVLNLFIQMNMNMNSLFKDLKEGTKNIVVHKKQGGEKFTNFDWTIQIMVENHLNRYFPNIKFVGEENTTIESVSKDFSSYITVVDEILCNPFSEEFVGNCNEQWSQEDLCIYFDPIDSTSSFIKGDFEPVTSLLGITCKGVPVCGMVHFPFYLNSEESATFVSIPNKGVFAITLKSKSNSLDKIEFDIKKVEVSKEEKFNFTITASRENPTMSKVLSFFKDHTTIRVSGLGNKAIIAMLKDYFYFAPSAGLGFWDICGPHALLKELGGDCVYVEDGKSVIYPENYENTNLERCVCMAPDNNKIKKFVEVIKENNISL